MSTFSLRSTAILAEKRVSNFPFTGVNLILHHRAFLIYILPLTKKVTLAFPVVTNAVKIVTKRRQVIILQTITKFVFTTKDCLD